MGRGRISKLKTSKDLHISTGRHTCKYCGRVFDGNTEQLAYTIFLHYSHMHKVQYDPYDNVDVYRFDPMRQTTF